MSLTDTIRYAFDNYKPLRDIYEKCNLSPYQNLKLDQLPFIDKKWLSLYSFNESFAVPKERLIRTFTTTGTTCSPQFVAFTEADWKRQVSLLGESFKKIGIQSGDIFYDIIPRTTIFAAYVALDAAAWTGALTVPAGKLKMEQHLHLLESIRPTVLDGLAFFVLRLGQMMSIPLREHVRIICLVGEPLYESTRHQIKMLFPNATIYSGYGISEIMCVNGCSGNSRYHARQGEFIV